MTRPVMGRLRGTIALAGICSFTAAAVATRDGRAGLQRNASSSGYAPPLALIQRVPGPRFVEIQEVRARDDGVLLYCSGVQGLLVADASDAAHARGIAKLVPSLASERFPRCQHLTFEGNIVYATSRGDELQPKPFVAAFDLARSPPAEIATFTKPGRSFEGIAASGGKIYVAMHGAGMLVLERAASGLVERGTATGLLDARGVDVAGSRAYVADGQGGLAVIDVADPGRPRLISRIALPGSAASVAVRGGFAYVAAGSAGVAVVDISDPFVPRLAGSAAAPGNALQISVSANFAFLADWNDARVYDISEPRRPRIVAVERVRTDSPLSRVLGIAARGTNVFVGEWTGMYAYELHPERRAPHLTVSQRSLQFGMVRPPATDSLELEVKNEGTAPLHVSSIEVRGAPAFAVEPRQLQVEPGQGAAAQVTFRPRAETVSQGALVLRTDDPSVREGLEVPLVGNAPGRSPGQRAPDVVVDLPDGSRWKLSEHRGDTVLLAYFASF